MTSRSNVNRRGCLAGRIAGQSSALSGGSGGRGRGLGHSDTSSSGRGGGGSGGSHSGTSSRGRGGGRGVSHSVTSSRGARGRRRLYFDSSSSSSARSSASTVAGHSPRPPSATFLCATIPAGNGTFACVRCGRRFVQLVNARRHQDGVRGRGRGRSACSIVPREFEVSAIHGQRVNAFGVSEHLVAWVDEWVPTSDLVHCNELLADFNADNSLEV